MSEIDYTLSPLGFLHSPLKSRGEAPNQGREGAPDAWLEVHAAVAEGLEGIAVGDEIIVITWLHQVHRDLLKTHPRNDETIVLATWVICSRNRRLQHDLTSPLSCRET
jgi:tRNA (Thr-GGU) A37 N-methylase